MRSLLALALVSVSSSSWAQDAAAPAPAAEAVAPAPAPEPAADGCVPDDGSVVVPANLEARGVPQGEVRRAKTALGTTLALGASGVSCGRATQAFAKVFAELDRIEKLVSTQGPDGGLFAVNDKAGVEPVVVDRELFALLEVALDYARITDGAFDPTFAALDGVWQFPAGGTTEPAAASRLPAPEAVQGLLPKVGWSKVVLDDKAASVFLPEAGMKLSLGGIAKGYAIDNAVKILSAEGLEHFIIRSGSEMYIAGAPAGGGHKVGVPMPRGAGNLARLVVQDRALNISRDGDAFFEEGGVRYHHILDPRTGYPAHHVRTVAVLAADATTADALSKALFVLGPPKAIELAEKRKGVEAILVDAEGRVWMTSGLPDGTELRSTPRR